MSRSYRSFTGVGLAVLVLGLVLASGGWAFNPKEPESPLDRKAFFKPELYISSENVPLQAILNELPNRGAWEKLRGDHERLGKAMPQVYIDPRSGAATNLIVSVPMIPGRGVGNRLKLEDVSKRIGEPVEKITPAAIVQLILQFILNNAGAMGIDTTQLGSVRVTDVSPDLWQITIPQTYKGVPVRYGRVGASINHGNLVLIGTETWGDVKGLNTKPTLSTAQALAAGWAYVGGSSALDEMIQQPSLEIIPVAPPKHQKAERFVGKVGEGYSHRLTWTFSFRRPPDEAVWEVIVDAHSGEVLSMQDQNHYIEASITGGVYPVTSTGICPTPGTCGTMQSGWPMPFANTGLAAPNNFTNSAGIFQWTSGTTTTTLNGQFVRIVDTCGAVSATSTTGSINMGGTNNQHDCTTGGGGAGNTPASRTAFYEVNKIKEQARGWLPTNTWLQGQLTTNVNLNQTCNAFWNGSTINFYRSGGGCRNTGEIASVFDHEWGHGMDDNDAAGALSNSSEGYADIAGIYRLQDSCVGHGFFQTVNDGCGTTTDGTGFNTNEAQQGAAHCDTDCSGVRDADWARHNPNTPDTALGFVCTSCLTGTGPCGRQVHCAAAPTRQAAWDLVARDLPAAGFNSQTSFMIGNRIFYLGSGNIGAWHTCTCGGTSGGCGSTNGYMQWLTADDNNGNLADGTPHMVQIFNAFNRHGIACATPTPQNSVCPAVATPTLSGTAGSFSNSLSWGAASGASRYWVFRTEGHAGCDFGKTRIADITGTSFVDTQVANGRQYSYNVVAQGTSTSCFSPVSNCLQLTPAASTTPDFSVSCSPSSLSAGQGGSATSTCTVTAINGFSSSVALSCTGLPAGVSCGFVPSSVTPTASSTLTVTVAGSATIGTFPFTVQGVGGSLTRTTPMSIQVTAPAPTTVYFDNFETATGWTTNPNGTDTATTGQWERGDPQTTTSSGTKQQGTTTSGTFNLVTGAAAGASAGVFDIDSGTTSIQSPLITLPSSGTLTLTFQFYLAHGTNSSTADFFRAFIVVGSTATQVFQELGAANDDDAAFTLGTVNLSSFAGQTIRIRFDAADASTASLVEAAVDDVRITQQ